MIRSGSALTPRTRAEVLGQGGAQPRQAARVVVGELVGGHRPERRAGCARPGRPGEQVEVGPARSEVDRDGRASRRCGGRPRSRWATAPRWRSSGPPGGRAGSPRRPAGRRPRPRRLRVTFRSAASALVDGSRRARGEPAGADRRAQLVLDLGAQATRSGLAVEREEQLGRTGTHRSTPTGPRNGSCRTRDVPTSRPRCARPSGCRSSTSWPIPPPSRGWPPRPRRPAGTAFFVWDHLNWRAPVRAVADPWITLAAVGDDHRAAAHRADGHPAAPADGRPRWPGRPRPWTGSAAAGSPSASVWAATSSAASSPRPASRGRRPARAGLLDESLAVLRAAWSGEPVRHQGRAPRRRRAAVPAPAGAAGRDPGLGRGLPGPVGPAAPGRAATTGSSRSTCTHPDQLAAAIDGLDLRDIVVARPAGTDVKAFADVGATWWLTDFEPESLTLDEVRGVLRDGPT